MKKYSSGRSSPHARCASASTSGPAPTAAMIALCASACASVVRAAARSALTSSGGASGWKYCSGNAAAGRR